MRTLPYHRKISQSLRNLVGIKLVNDSKSYAVCNMTRAAGTMGAAGAAAPVAQTARRSTGKYVAFLARTVFRIRKSCVVHKN